MTNEGSNLPGPNEFIEMWRKAAADAEQRWNDYFNELMGTEAFGQMLARSMDSYLTMQSTLARGMEQYLRTLNIPSRSDITQLAERVAMLEHKIDAIAAALGATESVDDGSEAPSKAKGGGRKRRQKSDARRDGE